MRLKLDFWTIEPSKPCNCRTGETKVSATLAFWTPEATNPREVSLKQALTHIRFCDPDRQFTRVFSRFCGLDRKGLVPPDRQVTRVFSRVCGADHKSTRKNA